MVPNSERSVGSNVRLEAPEGAEDAAANAEREFPS